MSGDPCDRCEIGDLLNGPVGKSGQDLIQVVADRVPELAAAFNHAEDRGHTRSGLLAADVDPVFFDSTLRRAWSFPPGCC